MRDNSLEMLWKCWRTFNHALLASPWGLRVMLVIPLLLRTSSKTFVQCGWRRVLMHDHSLCPCINISNVLRSYFHASWHMLCFCVIASVLVFFFLGLCFVYPVFVDLTLMLCFWVCWKIKKLIKTEKSQKVWSLVLCISHVEFGLIPPY